MLENVERTLEHRESSGVIPLIHVAKKGDRHTKRPPQKAKQTIHEYITSLRREKISHENPPSKQKTGMRTYIQKDKRVRK